ncbi:hypothetical protein [Devosia beringensis]|uniref:hypothetical protein n=1 Tax=Devosia beringensis TaxID=2657486 RepID=UPI00186BA47F|nr:hypothetical protein [Devosia beringensis]
MQGFFGTLAFIAVGAGFPIVYMWSLGQFVGQKTAPKWAKALVLLVASLAIGYSTLLAVVQNGFGDAVSLLLGGLLAGSGITGIVALQESFKGQQDVAE